MLLSFWETGHTNTDPTFDLYLGGAAPDTTPLFRFDTQSMKERLGLRFLALKGGFALLPDINGDGYDDWGIYWWSTGYDDGAYIFFGGEQPDLDPDINMVCDHGVFNGGEGDICGGDFNDDGYGDVVISNKSAYRSEGRVDMYFGRPGLPETIEADIQINGIREFGESFEVFGQYVGAVGDYNGDNVDDFVVRVAGYDGDTAPKMVIFAGTRDWRVNVTDLVPKSYQISLKAYPNPFNSTTTLTFDLPQLSQIQITIYNLSGQEVASLVDSIYSIGSHTVTWATDGVPSGVYIAVLKSDVGVSTTKMVVLK